MALNRKLSDKPFTSNYSDTARVHIYEPNDFSQSPTGSDYQVPASSLRDITANHFKDDYSIVSNTPILSNATGKLGDEVRCTDAGTRDLGSGDITAGVDDILAHNGSVWFKKVDNNQSTDISGKQDTLVSGTNIKTINGSSILGSGNLTISSGVTLTKKTITSANLTTQDVAGFLTYVNGVTPFAIASNEIVEYLVSDTGQIFKLEVNNRSVGSGETALTSADILLSFEDLTISTKSWASWQVGGLGTTAPVVQNGQALSVTGTAGSVAFDMDTPIKSIPFIKATGSSGAGQPCGWKEVNSYNVSLITGFDYYFTYMPEDTTANSRGFVGLYGSTAAIPNVEPSNFTVPNVGLAHDTTDTNLQIMHNDNAGASTKIPLGANFPANDNTKAYLLHLRSEPVSSSANAVIYWTVTELISKNSTSGVITTDLPRNSTTGNSNLAHAIWRNTGANATVPIVRMSKIFFRRLRA